MERWENHLNRVQTPDASVPSHRDALRKNLQAGKLPVRRGRNAFATLSLIVIMAVGGLAVVFPGLANDIVNGFLVKTITFKTKDGANVVIRKVRMNGEKDVPCDSTCKMIVVRATADGLKPMNPSERTFVISSTNNDQTWIINGDTLQANSMTTTVNDSFDLNDPPCGKFLTAGKNALPEIAPKDFELLQNYPNPFNPTTHIAFDLKESGSVSLKVFNVEGQEVATLVNGYTAAGHHSVEFDGSKLTSGAYLYTLRTEHSVMSKMMMLAK
jgi:hypothetical protein